jgi:K+-sensing histidine kinase KdpD
MPDISRKRLRRTTFTFWILLLYIIAALIWWFISLEKQNKQIAAEQYKYLAVQRDSLTNGQYKEQTAAIEIQYKKNTGKYISEGITFLLLILLGAVIVYGSVNKQFKLQLQQQNFMMAVTHELKTPIATTRLNLETLQKYNLDTEKQKKIIGTTLDEINRLNFLTNNILLSSQLEGGRYFFSKDELDLSDLFRDCVDDFRNRYPNRQFLEDIEPGVDIKGDPLLLQMLINNLMENAVKYGPKESKITAALKKNNNITELHVIDEGAGIPDDEKKKIFSKFYRIGNEATRKTQGTGLGLYLCRKIAKDHNADILVTNHQPHGSNFAVIFKS